MIISAERPGWRFVLRRPAHFIAFGFGAGLSPVAPGTVGTLVAFPLFWALSGLDPAAYFALVAALFAAGVRFCDIAGKRVGAVDHGGIVWDEIVAFLLVLPFAPKTVTGFGAAFALFRLFDVWKPFPIRAIDNRTTGGFGVMLDDLLAAGYTVAVLKIAGAMAGWTDPMG